MKKDLQITTGINLTSVMKMPKNEVSPDVLMKVRKALNCDVGGIIEFVNVGK